MTDPAIIRGNQAAEIPQTSQTSRLVDAVVAVLKAELNRDLHVDIMPDKPADFDLAERAPGAVLVHYRGSKYKRGGSAQPRDLTIDLHLRLRGQSGTFGAPVMVDTVSEILQGRQLAGSTAFQLESDGLVQEQGGLWDYVVTFTTELPRVARRHSDWRPY
ncbi:Gp37 family protein [Bosea vestrisii]|uniref:Gp37 family protein n=1 Tax=Bosea vestrisii TaxID=151416 RepID=A0ABW0H746_9HYPH